jgi:hypothetical protein
MNRIVMGVVEEMEIGGVKHISTAFFL